MFDFNELSNLYFSNVAGRFSPAVRNNNIHFSSAGAMKRYLLYVSAIISVLSMIGCSKFEDTTSVGSSVIDNSDPSFLDNEKNYTPFALSSDQLVDSASSSSIPDESCSNFGIHTSSVFPVGGKNGEIATAYYEFKTSFDNWKKVSGVDSLVQFSKIYSTALVFDTVNSSHADCNYAQDVHILRVQDSMYKYSRNQIEVGKILANEHLSDTILNISNLSREFSDSSLNDTIFKACTTSHRVYATATDKVKPTFKDSIKSKSFQFIVASKDVDKKYAFLKSSAALKVHMIRGEMRNGGSKGTKDTTIHIITDKSPYGRKTIFVKEEKPLKFNYDTLYNKSVNVTDTLKDTIYETKSPGIDTARHTTPLVYLKNNYRSRVNVGDSTLVIDSMAWNFDTLFTDTVITHFYTTKTKELVIVDSVDTNRIAPDTLRAIRRIRSEKIDSLFDAPAILAFDDTLKRTVTKVDTIVMKADSFYIPLSYSNYVCYEQSDTLKNRTPIPMSSYGPQRTAVFKLNMDSLWNKLEEPVSSTHPVFNKILSAGVAITGNYDSSFIKSMTDSTDTTIIVNWCVSEFPYNNGRGLFKGDKTWGAKIIEPGKEAVLPIEKNLQEISSRSVIPPKTVYLYLDIQSTKHYNKQVIWSKPSLISVLTTSKQ
jgi:hypothetical protein